MKAPIIYTPNFISNPNEALQSLQNDLDWERRDTTPRCEYYVNDFNKPYIYGSGRGIREYQSRPAHSVISNIRNKIESITNSKFEVCFLNRYLNQSDQLGWHSDNSPEMDDERPIAIVSLGIEREIWFRPIGSDNSSSEIEKLKLENGSLCLMLPSMQDSWQHRIPKASFFCGERISLTYRGFIND